MDNRSQLIPFPKNMTFEVWAAKVIQLYPELQIPIPKDEIEWEKWVSYLFLNPEFFRIPNVNVKTYPSWRNWAEFFINSLT